MASTSSSDSGQRACASSEVEWWHEFRKCAPFLSVSRDLPTPTTIFFLAKVVYFENEPTAPAEQAHTIFSRTALGAQGAERARSTWLEGGGSCGAALACLWRSPLPLLHAMAPARPRNSTPAKSSSSRAVLSCDRAHATSRSARCKKCRQPPIVVLSVFPHCVSHTALCAQLGYSWGSWRARGGVAGWGSWGSWGSEGAPGHARAGVRSWGSLG